MKVELKTLTFKEPLNLLNFKNKGRGALEPAHKFYPNNPRIVTPPWQLCNALRSKQAGLVRTFFY